MPYVRVGDLSFICLLVQEIKHVFDGQWKSAAAVCRAEHRLKQIVHKLLQRALHIKQMHIMKMMF